MAVRYVELKGVSSFWNVGRVVSRRTLGGTKAVLFPPDQRLSSRRGGPVYVGVTVSPGDTASAVLRAAIEAHPTYLGRYEVHELALEVQVEE